jgi:aldehyde dehydrogenase (NAD+)
MTDTEIKILLEKQREYFESGATLSVKFRKEMLTKLYKTTKKYENEINEALKADLGKCAYESFMCESGLALTEISYMLRHLKSFARKKRVHTPLSQFPSKSYKLPSPYGSVLIMSPWNYPFLLSIEPLTDAIAAGNTAIVKPSAYSPATSEIVKRIIEECFEPEYVAVVTGGRAENSALLDQRFDLIFFTGSGAVGKEVLRRSAERLTPAILELGGKSPCIVDKTANIPLAAKRIVFGKFLNCGQTCVAPDHVLIDSSVKDEFIKAVKDEIVLKLGKSPLGEQDYGRIVNQKHFERLLGLIDPKKVVHGGDYDKSSLKISPTVMDRVTESDAVMGEEIFGPILPVLTFENFGEMLKEQKKKDKPLALYIFSENKDNIHRATTELSFGGGCVNDVIIHLATSEMGFGGVGESGMGSYHGKDGFDAFTHYKSIVKKSTRIDLPMRYRPYKSRFFEKLLHRFLK